LKQDEITDERHSAMTHITHGLISRLRLLFT
jgi:hypothetical protein